MTNLWASWASAYRENRSPNRVEPSLAASLKPGAETTYWISYPTHLWSLRNFIPGSFRTANAEKLSHKVELEKMVPLWSRIRSKVILLQGIDDTLIFPENAPFAAKNLVNAASVSLTLVPGSKHDLLWTQTDLLKSSLLLAACGDENSATPTPTPTPTQSVITQPAVAGTQGDSQKAAATITSLITATLAAPVASQPAPSPTATSPG